MAELPPIEEIVFDLLDPDPCAWDHNHSCQAHGAFYLDPDELCPQDAAKRWLSLMGTAEMQQWLKEHGHG